MRPVKAERMQRGARGKAPARAVRGARVSAPADAFGKRARLRQDPVSRLARRVRGWFRFRRPMLLLALGVVAMAFLAVLVVGGTAGRTLRAVNDAANATVADAGFGISEVRIAGNQRTRPETILAALGFKPGESIFAADLQSARVRLMALDWVADADVQRRYPDAISVRLVEKLPYALWQTQQGLYVVERSGGVITDKDAAQFARLPLLAGDGAPAEAAELVDAVGLHRAVAARVKAYQRVSRRRWDLILDDRVVVQLPETGWRRELDTLEHLIVDKDILERSIAEIDLRSHTHYFFILKAGPAKDAGRGREL